MTKFWTWFKNSEVVLWAQVHVLLGIIWGVVSTTDLSPFINNPKVMTGWLILDGVITQWLRTRGTVYRDGHLIDRDTANNIDTMSPGDVGGK